MIQIDNFLIGVTLVFFFNLGLVGYLLYLRKKKKGMKAS